MRFLMCPPHYYGIEHGSHPPMSRGCQSNPQPAQEQWRGLYRLLEDHLDMEIVLVEPRKGLPDMVFAASAGLAWGNKFIASNFRHEARRGEAPSFENWFQVRGYEIFHVPEENCFEGEGDLLLCGDLLFAGYHVRSDMASHHKVAEILGHEILSLELTHEWAYHLDACFCPLGKGQALFCPAAFDPHALKVLEDNIATLIPVPDDEARRFVCNAMVAGKNIAVNDGCPQTREQLAALGFSVFETPLSEFVKAGGSAKCLVLKVPHSD